MIKHNYFQYLIFLYKFLFQVLGDQRKRQEYDMLGSAGYQANQQGGLKLFNKYISNMFVCSC